MGWNRKSAGLPEPHEAPPGRDTPLEVPAEHFVLGSPLQPPFPGKETALFGMGCFWAPEATFRKVDGVTSVSVGYMGGSLENPTYEEVCTGRTGHAEVVQVEFDPREVAYEELLEVVWACHDPTTRDRQGPDIGTQYRSVVFFHSPEQEAAARASKEKLESSGRYSRGIVTQIVPASEYYLAEEYHQRYLEKRRRRW